MTAIRRAGVTTTVPALAVAAAGCVVLVARPLIASVLVDQTAALVLLFAVLLAVGVAHPVPAPARATRRTVAPGSAALVTALGIAAFVAGRAVAGAHSAGPFTARFVLLNAFAAVAEEAFFRRFVYGLLRPGGAIVAVVGSAALFALVHVTVYGAWALPIDLAAGLLLGWQRWATGSWRAPAATHVLANVLAVL